MDIQPNNKKLVVTNKDYKKYLESKYKKYPLCKIKELIKIKNNKELKKYYKNIQSNEQIPSLINITNSIKNIEIRNYSFNTINRLLNILCRNTTIEVYYDVLKKIKEAKNDTEVYNYIKKLYYKKKISYKEHVFYTENDINNNPLVCNYKIVFAQQIAYNMFQIIKKVNKEDRYIDIGSGTGIKTVLFADNMGINKKNIYGIDIGEFSEVDNKKKSKHKKQINYSIIKINENYPFKNNYFRFVSAFMVLHHSENLDFTLKEINRITKMNGYFIIQEHDIFNIIDHMLVDIEHGMYISLYTKKSKETKKILGQYKAYYFNYIELNIILQRYGFEYLSGNYYSPSINFNIGANRTFWAIYKKVKNL